MRTNQARQRPADSGSCRAPSVQRAGRTTCLIVRNDRPRDAPHAMYNDATARNNADPKGESMRNLYDLVVVMSIGSAGLAACQVSESPSQGAETENVETNDLTARDWQLLHTLSPLPDVPEAVSYTHLRAHETPEHLV